MALFELLRFGIIARKIYRLIGMIILFIVLSIFLQFFHLPWYIVLGFVLFCVFMIVISLVEIQRLKSVNLEKREIPGMKR